MSPSAAARALTVEHRTHLVALRATAVSDLLRLWPLWDPRARSSWDDFAGLAGTMVQARNADAAGLAAGYYERFRAAEGIRGKPTPRLADPLPEEQVAAALSSTGLASTYRAVGAGFPYAAAREQGFAAAAGAVGRLVLMGSRQTIKASTDADPRSNTWARVTSGNACAFCELLAARGPVYSETGVDFEAHDHCVCSAEPYFGGAPTKAAPVPTAPEPAAAAPPELPAPPAPPEAAPPAAPARTNQLEDIGPPQVGVSETYESPAAGMPRQRVVKEINPAELWERAQTNELTEAWRAGGMEGTPTEFAGRIDDALAEILDTGKPHIRVQSDVLPQIVEEGRWKSQFETGTSEGALDPGGRAAAETNMFGYPELLEPSERPIYGYLAGDPYLDTGVSQYGDLAIRLKPEVLERTTWSAGDSLGPGLRPGGGKWASFRPVPFGESSELWRGATLQLEEIADGTIATVDELGAGAEYVEAQFHGGLSVGDIDAVLIPDVWTQSERELLEGYLDDAQIPWEVVHVEIRDPFA